METTISGLGFPKIRGTLLESPHTHTEDYYSILESILGAPYLRNCMIGA